MNLKTLAESLGGVLVFPKEQKNEVEITGVAPVHTAQSHQVSFLLQSDFELNKIEAGVLIVGKNLGEDYHGIQLVHDNPYYAFAKASQLFLKEDIGFEGISDKAFIHSSAKVDESATIFPGVYIAKDAIVGKGSIIFPGVYIGVSARIGDFSTLRANVVVEHQCVIGNHVLVHGGAVIGGDGFGFAPGKNDIAKIPQVGIVIIHDHVEIGPLCTVDRGTMDSTEIGFSTKLDSHVHVGHNVKIGQYSFLCGGVLLAGSCKIGDWCTLAGNVAVSNKIQIGNRITVVAKSGVTKDLTEPGYYGGYPAVPIKEWKRDIANLRSLQRLKDSVKSLLEKK